MQLSALNRDPQFSPSSASPLTPTRPSGPTPPLVLSSTSPLALSSATHLVVHVSATLDPAQPPVTLRALIDCGATACFASSRTVGQSGAPLYPLPIPAELRLIDNSSAASGPITHSVQLSISFKHHVSSLTCYVTDIGSYDLVLGRPWLNAFNPSIDWPTGTLTFPSPNTQAPLSSKLTPEHPHPTPTPAPLTLPSPDPSPLELICSATAPEPLDVDPDDLHDPFPSLSATDTPEYLNTLRSTVPSAYHDLLPAFSKAATNALPPHRPQFDHTFKIPDDITPPSSQIYHLSGPKLDALREWLSELQSKGFIRRTKSPFSAPVLLVNKPDPSNPKPTFRPCIDYRMLNFFTEKDRNPLPLISETFDRLGSAKIFTKLDLRGAFNLLRISPGQEKYTAFCTRYGLFECLVMPFGLTNAPASFQRLMNSILHDLLDVVCIVYLDDIIIFSDRVEEHEGHVRQVLQRLIDNHLYVKAEKCQFSVTSTVFLGHVVSTQGLSMDPARVSTLREWPVPISLRDVAKFIGFANAYRRYIPSYADIIAPLTLLSTKKFALSPFHFSPTALHAFNSLKTAFTSTPILRHFRANLPTLLETDASGFAISAILSQTHTIGSETHQHPVAYYSRKMTAAELNYPIHDKELLAIVSAVRWWNEYLESCTSPFEVYTDHQTLQYFQQSRRLSGRQLRWSADVNHHKYVIKYRPARLNGKADFLSRRPDWEEEASATLTALPDPIFRPVSPPSSPLDTSLSLHALDLSLPSITPPSPAIAALIQAALPHDPHIAPLIHLLLDPSLPRTKQQNSTLRLFSATSPTDIRHDGRHYVPPNDVLRVHILRLAHDDISAGHFGRDKTLELVRRTFSWPGLGAYVSAYVSSCDTCQHVKTPRRRPLGLLRPLPIPLRPWTSISWDHITELPPSSGYTAILVIVDRLTKLAHFVPTHTTDDSRVLASHFIQHVYRPHGLPSDIVSDRGATFSSKWWREVTRILGTQTSLSTAFHPQTDGQTERTNQTVEHFMRCFCDYQQSTWSNLLPLAEFAYNNSYHSAIGMSPFFATYGYHPTALLSSPNPTPPSSSPVPDASAYSHSLQQIHSHARVMMTEAAERNSLYANRHRSAHNPDDFAPGALVMVNRQHIASKRPTSKFDDRLIGPFPIISSVGTHAYRVDIGSRRIHNVFHVDRLHPYHSPSLIAQRPTLSRPPPEIPAENAYLVSGILNSRMRRRRLQYLVRWTGYAAEDDSWVPASEFDPDDELVLAFHQAHPDLPKAIRVRGRVMDNVVDRRSTRLRAT